MLHKEIVEMPSSRTMPDPELLRRARRESGLTQEEVGERAGLARNSISRYEAGSVFPSQLALNMLARIYNKPAEWFFQEASAATNRAIQQEAHAPVTVLEPPAGRSDEDQMNLPGRLKRARQKSGLTLEKAAEAVGTSFNTIWRYEAGQHQPSGSKLYALATLYGKPVEWFLGEEQDGPPAPDISESYQDEEEEKFVAGILRETRAFMSKRVETTPTGDLNSGDADTEEDIERLTAVAAAAGSGAAVYDETTKERVPFLTSWLREHSIRPADCNIISVSGDSMEPTIPGGSSIIVDRKRTEPREERIFVMRTEDGVVVKRLSKDEDGRWQVVSDNPKWETVPMLYDTDIIGEVRWSGRTH